MAHACKRYPECLASKGFRIISLFFKNRPDILLNLNRKELKRTYSAGWIVVLIAIVATSLGILGNITIDSQLFHGQISCMEPFYQKPDYHYHRTAGDDIYQGRTSGTSSQGPHLYHED